MKTRLRAVCIALCLISTMAGLLCAVPTVLGQQVLKDVTVNFVEAIPTTNVRSTVKAYISVTDLDGAPVTGLTDEHFTVFEDGVEVAEFDLGQATGGLWVVLVMDTTTSVGEEGLRQAKAAADRFVASMAPEDQIALYEFQEKSILREDFTPDHGRVRNSVGKLELVDKWTCLYDAGYTAVKKAMEIPKGRRAVVLMTDGRDDRDGKPCSAVSADDLIALAWTQRVPVYVVGLGKAVDEAVLKRIGEKTGGAFWSAPRPQDLEQAYAQIAKLLQSQYVVTYESTAPAGDHSLVIRVDYQGQQELDAGGVVVERTITPVVATETSPQPTDTPRPRTPSPTPTVIPDGDNGPPFGLLVAIVAVVGAIALLVVLQLVKRRRPRVTPVGPFPDLEEFPEYPPIEEATGTAEGLLPPDEEVTTEVGVDAVPQAVARLTVISSLELLEGESFDLYERGISIGRRGDHEIVIPDKSVSRDHAELRYEGGDYYAFDRGSRFGTRVNGVTVPPQGIKLQDGDQLQLGPRTTLRFTRLRTVSVADQHRTQALGEEGDVTTELRTGDGTAESGPLETS